MFLSIQSSVFKTSRRLHQGESFTSYSYRNQYHKDRKWCCRTTETFYRRFVDDIINCCKNNVADELFFKLNNYYWNIKLTIKISPTNFLGTQLVNLNGTTETKVCRKPNKLSVPWSWNIPKRYKRNPINGDMNRATRIATDFEKEIVQIKEKFVAANFHQDL